MSALDAALEVVRPTLDSSLVSAKIFGLMCGYWAKWKNSTYTVTDVEVVSTSDLYNPESGRKSRSFTVAGKLDVRAVDVAARRVLFDHKTTSEAIEDPNGSYWRQLVVEGQASHYMLLEWLNEQKVDYAIWDAVKKPGISPKAISKADQKALQETKQYFGFDATKDELESVAADGRETNSLYSKRLAYDCSIERPEAYFQRRQVPRLNAEVVEYAKELWGHGQDILHSRQEDRWPRNSGACMLYGRPCMYLGVCSGHDTIDSENWKIKTNVHNELPIIGQNGGKDVLTNSRIRTFQTCRKKHYFQYELGVERVEEEETESLHFGSQFHLAMEVFFNYLKEHLGQ